jgi:alpha-L-arabinofuranosidase
MYRWKDTIGPIEQRREQANIWGYHQTVGLGYFEYFQFCEDIGAQPLPVVPAGVCCQNSGQTGGTGQKGLPMDQMPAYLQEVLDLIEWANGPTNSTWGAKRAAAGHPEPFHLKYVGVGNEDHITPVFKERFKPIYDALKTKHPEIVVIGTVGPFHSGADFDEGWKFANEHRFDMVDEHYYEKPAWFLNNLKRYDNYDRAKSKVYLGEYAAHDEGRANTLRSALAEAAYMTMIERNGDIVRLASYAPLLAKERHTQWRPDLIYFDNTNLLLSANYYVQQMFGQNQGDAYLPSTVSATNLAVSCVRDSRTGDTILKFVNVTGDPVEARVRFPDELKSANHGSRMVLTGEPNGQNSFAIPRSIVPVTSPIQLGNSIVLDLPPHSLTVIRAGNPKGNRLEPQTGAVPQPILEGFTADPSIRVFGDTYYLYPTSDKPNWNTTEFAVWTSKNLIDWKKEGVILDVTKDLKWADLQAWAPDCVERNGTYYFYFCAREKIGVAMAKSPLGPFQDALDRPLIQKGGKVDIYPIDPYPFIDSDGQPYLYYGNGRCAQVFKLKPDMISFDGDPVDIPLKDFREGIVVFKRADKYYFMWSIDDARSPDYRVGWGIADKPLGPVRTPDKDFIVLRRHGAAVGTAHHSVVNVPGTDRWYVAYHRHAIPGGGGYQRETCLVRMEFDANGAIKPMDPLTAPFQLGDVGEPIAVAK